jgi:hypothetical protein
MQYVVEIAALIGHWFSTPRGCACKPCKLWACFTATGLDIEVPICSAEFVNTDGTVSTCSSHVFTFMDELALCIDK